jgi:penicillin-binding protein 1A
VTLSEKIASFVRAHRQAFVAGLVVLSVLMWSAVGVSAWLVRDIVGGLPGEHALRDIGAMARPTTLFDVHNHPAFTIFKEQRVEIPLARVSPHVIHALIAVEDQRFFDHGGVDVVRVAGAAWKNLLDGWGTQGGSTITQQLARQSLLTREKTITRKVKEIIVAARLESEFSKERILELYLNKVYFGDGLYGVEAASLGYFGKHSADLTVAEAALLAGLVKAPSAYAPTVSRERAVARRNAVLQAMREAGFIDGREYDTAVRTALRLNDTLRGLDTSGQYFTEAVRRQLVQQFGWERVYEGGLKVYTTIDLEMQKAAESEVQRAIGEIEKRQARSRRAAAAASSNNPLQAALVAMDPHTGEVRAMVGGRNFDNSRFNRVTQARRQPGSAFKPLLYAAALERGYTPASLISNLNVPVMTLQGAWVPEDGHSSATAMTIRSALRASSNRAAVRMLQEVGIDSTVRYAQRLGVGSVPSVPSLALGSGEVTLLSLTAAYSSFANQGMRPEPILIRRVESADGEVLFNASPHTERAVSEATAFLMTSMMADVVNAGTGWQARRVGFTRPAAGKTGTTNDFRDAWFVGYTPHLASGVWVGYDMPRTIIGNGFAGDLAVPLWGRFMNAATREDPADWFRPPATVTSAQICRLSGKLATDGCRGVIAVDEEGNTTIKSQVYTEYFVRGTEPADYCPLHQGYGEGFYTNAVGTSGQSQGVQPAALSPPTTAPPPASPQAVPALPPPTQTAPAVAPVTSPLGAARAEGATLTPESQATGQPERRRNFWSRFFRRGERPQDPAPQQGPPSPPPPPRDR